MTKKEKIKLGLYKLLSKLGMVTSPYEIYGRVALGSREFSPPSGNDRYFLNDFKFTTYYRDTARLIQAAMQPEWKAYNRFPPFKDSVYLDFLSPKKVRETAKSLLEEQLENAEVHSLDEARRIGKALGYSDEESEENLKENNPEAYEILQNTEKAMMELKNVKEESE